MYTRVTDYLQTPVCTVQTGVYDHPYTRVSLSANSGLYGNGTDGCRDNETRVTLRTPPFRYRNRPEFTIIRTLFHYRKLRSVR